MRLYYKLNRHVNCFISEGIFQGDFARSQGPQASFLLFPALFYIILISRFFLLKKNCVIWSIYRHCDIEYNASGCSSVVSTKYVINSC